MKKDWDFRSNSERGLVSKMDKGEIKNTPQPRAMINEYQDTEDNQRKYGLNTLNSRNGRIVDVLKNTGNQVFQNKPRLNTLKE